MICISCKKEIDENCKFCGYCGTKTIVRVDTKKGHRLRVIIGNNLGVIIIMAIIIFYVLIEVFKEYL